MSNKCMSLFYAISKMDSPNIFPKTDNVSMYVKRNAKHPPYVHGAIIEVLSHFKFSAGKTQSNL